MNLKSVAFAVVCCISVVGVSNAQPQKNNEQKEPPTYTQLLKEMDKNEKLVSLKIPTKALNILSQ